MKRDLSQIGASRSDNSFNFGQAAFDGSPLVSLTLSRLACDQRPLALKRCIEEDRAHLHKEVARVRSHRPRNRRRCHRTRARWNLRDPVLPRDAASHRGAVANKRSRRAGRSTTHLTAACPTAGTRATCATERGVSPCALKNALSLTCRVPCPRGARRRRPSRRGRGESARRDAPGDGSRR